MTHVAARGCMVLPLRRMRSLTLARNSRERALSRMVSKSLARRRLQSSHATVRSITQRRGRRRNPVKMALLIERVAGRNFRAVPSGRSDQFGPAVLETIGPAGCRSQAGYPFVPWTAAVPWARCRRRFR